MSVMESTSHRWLLDPLWTAMTPIYDRLVRALKLAFVASTAVSPIVVACTSGPAPGAIKNLVTFGDSYTAIAGAGDGGTPWPVYAADPDYGNFSLYPFAVSSATCSNLLTPHPVASVLEGQIPAYRNATGNGAQLDPSETMYTLWIGTNDLGVLLLGQQEPGVTVVDTTECVAQWVQELYQSGARNFLVQNMLTLQDIPFYANYSYPNRYWTAPRNTTEWHLFMTEMTVSGNTLYNYMLSALPASLPDAHIGIFDSYGLFSDMIANPGQYLNGTAPLNVTYPINTCIFQVNESTSDGGVCTSATGTDRDSFLWWDEVHPSEQADRIVAREISAVINGSSTNWTTWLS